MKTAPLTTSESFALDIIRFVAAAVVAFGHLTQHFFSTGWMDLTFAARCAVAVFFLLSGFVIRYVTCRKPATLKHYLGDRASRIYSVALPALLFTLLADSISRHVNPAFYSAWEGGWTHPLLAIGKNLIFCGQLWTHNTDPLSNSPFWSINYEVAYYLLYGCWFYLAGPKRWFWIAGICLFFGPRVLYLAPLWILGCVAHDLYQQWTSSEAKSYRLAGIALGSVSLLIVSLAALCMATGKLLPQQSQYALLRISFSSNVTPPDYLFGAVWSIAFVGLLFAARQVTMNPRSLLVRATRFFSEGTFPIYLLHFPLYVLIAACIPYNHASPAQKIAIYIAALTSGILVGHPGNILKNKLRTLNLSWNAHPFAPYQRSIDGN